MKKCNICLEELDEKRFYKTSNQCTKCKNEKNKENKKRWIEENRDHVRRVVHEHYLKNRESVIERTKIWRQNHKDEFKRMHGLSKEKYRERWRARKNLNYHLNKGNIIKAKFCDMCGEEKKLQAHHDDYSKPLAVKWICSTCHGYLHREFKE